MKNKIILILILLLTANASAFAVQESKVVSDSATKNQVINAFGSVNQYTNNFFTPHIEKKVVDDESKSDLFSGENQQHRGTTPPVKKFRLMIQNRNKPKAPVAVQEDVSAKDTAVLDCETMQYFAERTELEADGHAVMVFPQNNSTIKADKMIYNQTSNMVKAYGNVVLINDGKTLYGDFMQIDMNEENGFMDHPTTAIFQLRAKAQKGYMYGDKIIQEQGSMYVTKKTMIHVASEMFGPNLDTMYVADKDKSYYKKDSHGEKFKIKTNDLIINSKKDHDVVTLKHAEIYFSGKKICTVPSISLHTNKNQDYAEASYPEFGTMMNLGSYIGPGFVFDTPKGTTLKVVPILNYQGNTDDSSFGYGAIAKFKSANNFTDFAYGTSNKTFLMRGKQKLDDNLYFQYGANTYMDDSFMGYRMPKLLGELIYEDINSLKDFVGKDKDMSFTTRLSVAYAQSGAGDSPLFNSDDGIGTMRFKYMTEAAQTFWKYKDYQTSPINASFQIVGHGSSAVYGTGDTQMLVGIGPRLHTQYNWWMQDVGYFLHAYTDNTPLKTYDAFMYGRSNAYLRESARLSKYLTVSWFGSFNLSNDAWNGNLMQENGFYFSIGPDDVKLMIGYDTVRQQSFITMAVNLDAKGSSIDYKKMIIKNPDTLGKDPKKDQSQQAFSSASSDTESDGLQRAIVEDVPQEAL